MKDKKPLSKGRIYLYWFVILATPISELYNLISFGSIVSSVPDLARIGIEGYLVYFCIKALKENKELLESENKDKKIEV